MFWCGERNAQKKKKQWSVREGPIDGRKSRADKSVRGSRTQKMDRSIGVVGASELSDNGRLKRMERERNLGIRVELPALLNSQNLPPSLYCTLKTCENLLRSSLASPFFIQPSSFCSVEDTTHIACEGSYINSAPLHVNSRDAHVERPRNALHHAFVDSSGRQCHLPLSL